MSDHIDQEVEAIGTVLRALEPLDTKARMSVLRYVTERLEIGHVDLHSNLAERPEEPVAPAPVPSPAGQPIHLEALVREKSPKSAIEMATLVAYYLSNVAPADERRETLTTNDITTYFKIGGYRLPKEPKYTLSNTKNAGYVDAAGNGEYRLNPVGYNLVVHSMPTTSERSESSRSKKPRTSRRKTGGKTAAKTKETNSGDK